MFSFFNLWVKVYARNGCQGQIWLKSLKYEGWGWHQSFFDYPLAFLSGQRFTQSHQTRWSPFIWTKYMRTMTTGKKMLKLNDILSNALLYLHESPFSFASSPYVISFQSLIKMLCNILKHILCPSHITARCVI